MARFGARKFLASGDVIGACARTLRLYVGTDDGRSRTYKEVGHEMGMERSLSGRNRER